MYMQVLLADQASLFRQMIQKTVTETTIECVPIDHLAALKSALDDKSPSLLVLCTSVPGMEDSDLVQSILSHPNLGHVPVFIVKSASDSELHFSVAQGLISIYSKSELEKFKTHLIAHLRRLEQQYLQGKILFVEDSDIAAENTGRVLDRHGLKYDRFVTVEEALVAFDQNDYDLVLSDYFLKGALTGVDLVRAVRSRKDSKSSLPILVLSADMDKERRVEVLYAGASDYISKPVLYEELIARLSTQLRMHDILIKLEAKSKEFEQMAIRDHLTGLYNRTGLSKVIQKQLRENLDLVNPVSAVILDIDFFKKINDGYGHNIGDEVLRGFGQVVQSMVEEGDYGIRFGGEEFLVLKTNSTAEKAKDWGNAFLQKLSEVEVAGLMVTASVGVATVVMDQTGSFDGLLLAADQALYSAKATGRNRVVVYGE